MFTNEENHDRNKIVQLNESNKESRAAVTNILHYPLVFDEVLLLVSKCLKLKKKGLHL